MFSKGLVVLLWVTFTHLAGIYLFTRGFLLTRLSLSEYTSCPDKSCTLPPTHKRAVLLIIDALRFDFITPNPPNPPSPFHHNVLTLPRDLSATRPRHSLLFNSYTDPPTSTLQRIKALATGSLPTFVDIGSNFGGSSITEDSLLQQLSRAGKKVAFMGDDTWITVFPGAFQANMSFPYDSFNVEDLHTVDEGVIRHLFPLLMDKTKPFDFLIGHFLGVDHVGHRVGPDHPSMKAKLEQMNQMLTHVVDMLDDDTLLIVLGDHGMDKAGDHGGDSVLETSAGLWIYSKTTPISHPRYSIPISFLSNSTFPGSTSSRAIQQIDLVPSLSLLLGLPIPLNNLGTVIPELFWREEDESGLIHAMQLNAAQIKQYLEAYRASVSGDELDDIWPELQAAFVAIEASNSENQERLIALHRYTRLVLESCRSLWARFNPVLMGFGLILIGVSLIATWALYSNIALEKNKLERCAGLNMPWCVRGIAAGAIVGFLTHLLAKSFIPGVDALDCVLFGSSLLSCFVFVIQARKTISFHIIKSIPVPLVLHMMIFLSNSFTVWEDRILTFLLASSIVSSVLTGLTAPTTHLRNRILGFSLLFAACVRLMAISTVCREEQQPYCHVTFFATSSLPSPSLLVLLLALPTSSLLPLAVQRFLGMSKSGGGVAQVLLPWILRPALLGATVYWLVEHADSTGIIGDDWLGVSRGSRTAIAIFTMGIALIGGVILWWPAPLCLEIDIQDVTEDGGKKPEKQVTVLGFANAFGSSYLMLWSLALCIVYATSQLTGQLVLALGTIAILAHLEVVDSVRDVKNMHSITAPNSSADTTVIQFEEIVPLALLGLHMFYGTGHQSVISTIQWKSAFLLTPTVTYPLSPLTVLINSFGSLLLVALAVPLLALWNRAPPLPSSLKADGSGDHQRTEDDGEDGAAVLAALGMMIYFASLLFGTAVSAAVLRRHLMVWKVFAPRFMCAVIAVLVVDVSILFGIGTGVARVRKEVLKKMYGMFTVA